jgi:hypothetical protein
LLLPTKINFISVFNTIFNQWANIKTPPSSATISTYFLPHSAPPPRRLSARRIAEPHPLRLHRCLQIADLARDRLLPLPAQNQQTPQ